MLENPSKVHLELEVQEVPHLELVRLVHGQFQEEVEMPTSLIHGEKPRARSLELAELQVLKQTCVLECWELRYQFLELIDMGHVQQIQEEEA